MLISFRRVCVVALINLDFFQIGVSLGSFNNLIASSASSAKVELKYISSPSSSACWGWPLLGPLWPLLTGSGYSGKRNLSGIHLFLSFFRIFNRFSFFNWRMSSFIDIHCCFSSVTNLNSYSGCSSLFPTRRGGG